MTNKQRYLLTCLMEECGEVVQAASKIIRKDSDGYPHGEHHWENLVREVHDVITIMRGLNIDVDESLIDKKDARLADYINGIKD